MDEILGYEDVVSRFDELQNEETSIERRTEILVELKQERGLIHTKLDADSEKMSKLEQLNADIKATNQQLYNQLPPTYVSPNAKEEKKQSEREEQLSKVSISQMLANS